MNFVISYQRQLFTAALLLALCLTNMVFAQTTAFTYQGKLTDSGNPANGTYDMQFKLFDTVTVGTGTQQGSTITNSTVQVVGGIFNVTLDFGANVFTGATRYLEIGVRPAGSPNPYTTLAPRQQITSSPYAIQTLNATQLGGLPASRYVATDTNGNVGIGTPTPNTRLTLTGGAPWTNQFWSASMNLQTDSAIGWEANASGQRFGLGQSAGGLYFFRTNSAFGNTASPPNYDLVISDAGNVGIGGATNPFSKLTVLTPSGNYGLTHTNGTVTVGSYVDGTAGWLGTQSNHPLKFFTNNSASLMTITTNGLVGIGTPSPTTRLEVVDPTIQLRFGPSSADNGGYLVSTNPSQAIIAGGAKWNGTTWIARDSAPSLTAHQNGVIQFFTDSGKPIGSTFNPTLRMQIDADGNVRQTRDKGGLLKAMVYVNGTGGIDRCYNGITGSSTGNCGFSVTNPVSGTYIVDFGFPVHDRFYSATPSAGVTGLGLYLQFNTSTTNQILVATYNVVDGSNTNGPFCIIIF